MFLVTAEEMREIDRQSIEGIGIPGIVLMENAGLKVAEKIKELIPKQAKVVVLAGHGNNGGDGFVIARHLGNGGYDVETWFVGDIQKSSADSIINFHALVHSGYKLKFWNESNDYLLKESLNSAEFIIDALLGTGAKGELREPYKNIIDCANNAEGIRLAVDMPTGVDSNTGEVIDVAFKAAYTVTFAFPKIGQFMYPGVDYIGELTIADISIPPIILQKVQPKVQLITHDMVKERLPHRKKSSHKGTYGHSLIIGGSADMPGAPTLATKAALRTGTGLATIAVTNSIRPMVFGHLPEAICKGLPETAMGHFSLEGIDLLDLETNKYTAIGIGPGMGIWEQGRDWLSSLLKLTNQPIVIDADALNLLTNDLNMLKSRNYPTILTPHPGEMARLLKRDIQYVASNRIGAARQIAHRYGVYVVLKGANTVIATPNEEVYINSTGGPELAKGGTGDVLTGMLTGLLAQKLPVLDAILIGVYLHGLAGSIAGYPSNYSTLASEVINNIGSAIYQTMSNRA